MFWIHNSRVFEKFFFARVGVHISVRHCVTKYCAYAAENYILRIELVTPWGGMALLPIFLS